MSDICAIPTNVSSPFPDAEPGSESFEEQFAAVEQDELPQGVLALIQQMTPQDKPLAMPLVIRLASSATLSDVDVDVDVDANLRMPVSRQPVDMMAARLPGGASGSGNLPARSETAIAVGATPLPASAQTLAATPSVIQPAIAEITTQAADADGVVENARSSQVFVPPAGIRAASDRAVSSAERVEKPVQSFEPPPVQNAASRAATPLATSEQPVSLRNTLAQAATEGQDKGEQSYLRLPFASDRATGHVNVSKAPHDFAGQLQLSGSSVDVTRQLAQHLSSAEPGWQLLDGQDANQDQQDSDARQQADDDSDDAHEHPGHGKWQG